MVKEKLGEVKNCEVHIKKAVLECDVENYLVLLMIMVKLPEKILKTVLEPSVCTKLIYIVLQVKDKLDVNEAYNALYVIGRVYQMPDMELSLETNQFVCEYTQKMLSVEETAEQAAKVVAILTHSSTPHLPHRSQQPPPQRFFAIHKGVWGEDEKQGELHRHRRRLTVANKPQQ